MHPLSAILVALPSDGSSDEFADVALKLHVALQGFTAPSSLQILPILSEEAEHDFLLFPGGSTHPTHCFIDASCLVSLEDIDALVRSTPDRPLVAQRIPETVRRRRGTTTPAPLSVEPRRWD